MTILETAIKSGKEIDILCIGTPKIFGDAIGPMVGTILKRQKVKANVIGSLDAPVISSTYDNCIKQIRPGSFVVVVDAGISSKGKSLCVYDGPTRPGLAIRNDIPPIGDVSITCYTGKDIDELLECDLHYVHTTAHLIANDLITIIGLYI